MDDAINSFKFKPVSEVWSGCRGMFAPPPDLLISEWADQFRRLSPEASAEIGQWRTSRAPYLREIMDCLKTHQKVVVMSSSQVGKTELFLNTIGYFMNLDPCPIMFLQPTIEMAETISKDRIAPMIRDTPVLTGLVGNRRSRDSENTILHKTFKGGHLTLAGANSPASLASRPIKVLLVDECDRFPVSAGREGDPIKLAIKRTATFWNRTIGICSTPTIKDSSRIEYEFNLSDKRRYYVPCPHCGEFQLLTWERVKFEDRTITDKEGNSKKECVRAWYECTKCQGEIIDAHRSEFLRRGEWRATAASRIPGFHLWQAYSPWSSFYEIVQDYLDCYRNGAWDKELLKVWTNTCLGEAFDEQGGEGILWQVLMSRCEPYAPLSVPAVAILTAGVDFQKDRIAVSVWAWGRGEEGWLVYHSELFGNTADVEDPVWGQLEAVLSSSFTHSSGKELKILAACLDTGFLSQEVYLFSKKDSRYYAVKGLGTGGRPILSSPSTQEINYKGKKLKRGVKLWPIGVNLAKSVLFNRLGLSRPGPGFLHFPIGMDQEYFEQVTAEKAVRKFSKGVGVTEWVKVRSRNEALDCLVYAYAAALLAGLSRYNFSELERSLQPTEDKPEDIPPVQTGKKKERSGWVGKRDKWM